MKPKQKIIRQLFVLRGKMNLYAIYALSPHILLSVISLLSKIRLNIVDQSKISCVNSKFIHRKKKVLNLLRLTDDFGLNLANPVYKRISLSFSNGLLYITSKKKPIFELHLRLCKIGTHWLKAVVVGQVVYEVISKVL